KLGSGVQVEEQKPELHKPPPPPPDKSTTGGEAHSWFNRSPFWIGLWFACILTAINTATSGVGAWAFVTAKCLFAIAVPLGCFASWCLFRGLTNRLLKYLLILLGCTFC